MEGYRIWLKEFWFDKSRGHCKGGYWSPRSRINQTHYDREVDPLHEDVQVHKTAQSALVESLHLRRGRTKNEIHPPVKDEDYLEFFDYLRKGEECSIY